MIWTWLVLILVDIFELRVGCGFQGEFKPQMLPPGAAPSSALPCSQETVCEQLR